MMHALLAYSQAAPDPLARWEVVVSLLAGMAILLGGIWRTGRRVVKAITAHVSVTEANTKAIETVNTSVKDLTKRVVALEDRVHV